MEASQQKACVGCVELKGIHLLFEFRFSTFTPLTKIVLTLLGFPNINGVAPFGKFWIRTC